jgi:hypothetical protein
MNQKCQFSANEKTTIQLDVNKIWIAYSLIINKQFYLAIILQVQWC